MVHGGTVLASTRCIENFKWLLAITWCMVHGGTGKYSGYGAYPWSRNQQTCCSLNTIRLQHIVVIHLKSLIDYDDQFVSIWELHRHVLRWIESRDNIGKY